VVLAGLVVDCVLVVADGADDEVEVGEPPQATRKLQRKSETTAKQYFIEHFLKNNVDILRAKRPRRVDAQITS
jgi:hypothetical protein